MLYGNNRNILLLRNLTDIRHASVLESSEATENQSPRRGATSYQISSLKTLERNVQNAEEELAKLLQGEQGYSITYNHYNV